MGGSLAAGEVFHQTLIIHIHIDAGGVKIERDRIAGVDHPVGGAAFQKRTADADGRANQRDKLA